MINFFRKIYIRLTVENDVSIAFGLPEVDKVGSLLLDKKYEKIVDCYRNLRNDEKSLLLDGVALNDLYINQILEWHKEEPDHYLANLFAGVAYTFIAWKLRSNSLAKYVSSSQFEGFHNHLVEAKRCLFKAASLMPSEPETYARLIRVHMGLSEKEEAKDAFNTLLTIDDKHFGGHFYMVNLLAPKWLGSFEEMREFAFQFKNVPKNDLRYAVFLQFVIQYFIDLSDKDIEKAIRITKKKFKTTVMKTYAEFDIPSIPSLQRYYLHNHFSYIFYVIDQNKLRNKEINLVGNHITLLPWGYTEVDGHRDLQLMKFE